MAMGKHYDKFETPPPRVSPPELPLAPRVQAGAATAIREAEVIMNGQLRRNPQLYASGCGKRRKVSEEGRDDGNIKERFFLLKPSALFSDNQDDGRIIPTPQASSVPGRRAPPFLQPRHTPFEDLSVCERSARCIGSPTSDAENENDAPAGQENHTGPHFRPIQDPRVGYPQTEPRLGQKQHCHANRVSISPSATPENNAGNLVRVRAVRPTLVSGRSLFTD